MINYITGDAIESPEVSKPKLLLHIVNDCSQWGAGIVVPIGKKWPKARQEYLDWAETQIHPFELGNIQIVKVEKGICVVNMLAQSNKKWVDNEPPCKLNHLETCLNKVSKFIEDKQPFFDKPISVVLPKIGCGIGGLPGFYVVEPLINIAFCQKNIPVFVYSLP